MIHFVNSVSKYLYVCMYVIDLMSRPTCCWKQFLLIVIVFSVPTNLQRPAARIPREFTAVTILVTYGSQTPIWKLDLIITKLDNFPFRMDWLDRQMRSDWHVDIGYVDILGIYFTIHGAPWYRYYKPKITFTALISIQEI